MDKAAEFDRLQLRTYPLGERANRVKVESDMLDPYGALSGHLGADAEATVQELATRMRAARAAGAPRIMAFGAHTIKNGLGPVLIRLIEEGWFTLLATNGAGIIHDWELAFQGLTSEDVRANTAQGRFGLWEETGRNLNLALLVGAWRGLGYGESVGTMILDNGLTIPAEAELLQEVVDALPEGHSCAGAACDLLDAIRRHGLGPGRIEIKHPYLEFSLQAAARRLGVPFTGHPMFGHDIIYTHPTSYGAAIGRCAEHDFLRFAAEISRIDHGVYLSVGSAVMSPMVFEKSFSMAMNLALQAGRSIRNHYVCVVDLMESTWDWATSGEPPADDPAYYMRFLKTFSRMGGTMQYLAADNRVALHRLYQVLHEQG
ncbi:MAG: hypothetical protein EA428_06370 [Spirochaetaceae bacterium]|nr:MAG: hypothetical protein EA428_06370 [Spirochaetaceae bacterium]